MRLGDLDNLPIKKICKENKDEWECGWNAALNMLVPIKGINPETLPIVRQLREELDCVTAERDAAVRDLEQAITIYRDVEGWDILCRFCNGKSCLNDGECNPKWRSLRKEE